MKVLALIRYDAVRQRRHTMKQRVAEASHRAGCPNCQANEFFEALGQKMRAIVAEVGASGSPATIELQPSSPTTKH